MPAVPATLGAEAGGSQFQGQPEKCSKTLYQGIERKEGSIEILPTTV